MNAPRVRSAPFALWLGMAFAGWALARPSGADLEKFTPHHVAKIRAVTSAAISPDGSKVAYVLSVPRKPNVDEDGPSWAELHVVGPDGKSRPFVTGEVNVAEPTWTRDGNSILFLAKRGKDEHRSLYKIEAEGGEARRVVTFGSDITGFAVKADGKRVAFLATEPEPKAKADQKKKGFTQILYEEEQKPVRLWLATLDDPARPRARQAARLGLRAALEPGRRAARGRPGPDARAWMTTSPAGRSTSPSPGPADWSGSTTRASSARSHSAPTASNVAMISAADQHDPAAGRLVVGSVETGPDAGRPARLSGARRRHRLGRPEHGRLRRRRRDRDGDRHRERRRVGRSTPRRRATSSSPRSRSPGTAGRPPSSASRRSIPARSSGPRSANDLDRSGSPTATPGSAGWSSPRKKR